MNINDLKGKDINQITQDCISNNGSALESRMCIIDAEFRRGFEMMGRYPKSVSIFGSARLDIETEPAQKIQALAKKIANMGYAVVTGGGYGIMGAANKGAQEAEHGHSLGINIQLPHEQNLNEHVDEGLNFHHFYSRKVTLAYYAEAYIYCAGGFGTLDEFFEILTLKQTKKIPDVPIILYGSGFWQGLDQYMKDIFLRPGLETIDAHDCNLYIITDNDEEVLEIIKNTPTRLDADQRRYFGE